MVDILNEDNEAEFFASEKALKAVLFSNTIASIPACPSQICAETAKTRTHTCYPALSIDYEATYIVRSFASSGVAS
jgi:hypothetical protein